MSDTAGIMLFIVLIVVYATTMIWANRKFSCSCGKSHSFYFPRIHEKTWLMSVWATLFTIVYVVGLFGFTFTPGNVLSTILNILVGSYWWLRVYYHEKDKIKKAASALGRVVIKDNGRLAVEPT